MRLPPCLRPPPLSQCKRVYHINVDKKSPHRTSLMSLSAKIESKWNLPIEQVSLVVLCVDDDYVTLDEHHDDLNDERSENDNEK